MRPGAPPGARAARVILGATAGLAGGHHRGCATCLCLCLFSFYSLFNRARTTDWGARGNGPRPAIPTVRKRRKHESHNGGKRHQAASPPAAAFRSEAAAACTRWHSAATADRSTGSCCMNSHGGGAGVEKKSGKRARTCPYIGHTNRTCGTSSTPWQWGHERSARGRCSHYRLCSASHWEPVLS